LRGLGVDWVCCVVSKEGIFLRLRAEPSSLEYVFSLESTWVFLSSKIITNSRWILL